MAKRHSSGDNSKYQQFDDDFEDFGYEVKNIRRQTKKKVAKFKREVNEYDDTYWTGIVTLEFQSRSCIVYMFGIFFMSDQLEMLMAREQLMEDIISIVESQLPGQNVGQLEQLLCDAVCEHFPAKWYKPVSRPTSWQGVTLEVAIRQTLCL